MIENKTKPIGKYKFTFLPMHATPAREMLAQLTNKVGPSIADGIDGLKDAGKFNSVDVDLKEALPALSGTISGLVRGLSTSLTPTFYANLIDTFLCRTTVEMLDEETNQIRHQKLDTNFRDIFFAVDLLLEAQVLGFCLETQYADFSKLLQKGAMYTTLLATKTQTPSNSDSQTG